MLDLRLDDLRPSPQPAPAPTWWPTRPATPQAEQEHGRLCAFPADRLMTIDGRPVTVGSRAFDLLLALLDSSGSLVSKDDLIRRVWPTTRVDDCNLRTQMAALRRAMGPVRHAIRTVPGRGYMFAPALARLHPAPLSPKSVPELRGDDDSAPNFDRRAVADVRIAVIDSDDDARGRVRTLLEHLGVPTDEFSSAAEFAVRESDQPYLCVIVEQWLQGGDGMNLLRDLLEHQSVAHVIVTSAYPDVHAAVQAMKMGASDFLPKPVQGRDLVQAVYGLCGHLGPTPHSATC